MITCPRCGTRNPSFATMCERCGADLSSTRRTPSYGRASLYGREPQGETSIDETPIGVPYTQASQDGGFRSESAGWPARPGAASSPTPAAGTGGSPGGRSLDLRGLGIVVTVVLIIGALLLGGIGVYVVLLRRNDPSRMLDAYLTALRDGEYSKAAGYEGAPLQDSQKILLTDAVAAESSYRIDSYKVTDEANLGDKLTFTVDYSIDSRNREATVVFERTGRNWGLPKWSMTRSLLSAVEVSVPQGDVSVEINGVSVSSANTYGSKKSTEPVTGDAVRRFAVYPGRYTVSASSGSKYFDVEADSDRNAADVLDVADAPLSADSVGFSLVPNDAFLSTLDTQVAAAFRSCLQTASSGTKPDSSCGIYIGTDQIGSPSYSNVTFAADGEPDITQDAIRQGIDWSYQETGPMTGSFQVSLGYTVTSLSAAPGGAVGASDTKHATATVRATYAIDADTVAVTLVGN